MSKLTQRKSLDYVKKKYKETRRMSGSWYLSHYKYKFNVTHMQPFLSKLKEKKLVGLECSGCNTVYFPPRFVCGKCLMKPDRWVDVRETGRISTYVIAYLKNPETGEVQERPSILVHHDGTDTSSLAELNPEVDFKNTYIGMPIKVHWTENPSGGLMDIEYYDLLEDHSKDLDFRED
jgi:uncharacterized OB-fold protein